ncbi:hypothetical protein [Bradyrhizobium genosp. SA-3]|nr:hypothetical protein [Bradyrhizobium genosp. SA-3]
MRMICKELRSWPARLIYPVDEQLDAGRLNLKLRQICLLAQK